MLKMLTLRSIMIHIIIMALTMMMKVMPNVLLTTSIMEKIATLMTTKLISTRT